MCLDSFKSHGFVLGREGSNFDYTKFESKFLIDHLPVKAMHEALLWGKPSELTLTLALRFHETDAEEETKKKFQGEFLFVCTSEKGITVIKEKASSGFFFYWKAPLTTTGIE